MFKLGQLLGVTRAFLPSLFWASPTDFSHALTLFPHIHPYTSTYVRPFPVNSLPPSFPASIPLTLPYFTFPFHSLPALLDQAVLNGRSFFPFICWKKHD